MSALLARIRNELGALAIVSLALLATSAAFFIFAVKPLEERAMRLDRQLASTARRSAPEGITRVGAGTPEARITAFYRFFEREENTVEWLAKIYGIAGGAGLELRTAEYRLAETRQRIERYQITLPVAGSYAQIRSFLEGALAEIPVLSLDQVSFRRKSAAEPRVEAEVVLTLHLLRK